MQHAFFMRGGESGAQLARNFQSLVFGQAADAAQERAQILAIDVFHREKEIAVEFAEIVDAAHVGMRDAARDADFVAESIERGWDSLRLPAAEISARPAGRGSDRRRDKPRPCRRGRASR